MWSRESAALSRPQIAWCCCDERGPFVCEHRPFTRNVQFLCLQSNWCGDGLNIACHKVVLHDRSSSNFNIVSSRLYAMCFATIVEPFSERENRGEKTPAFTRGTLSLRVYCWGKIPLLPCVTARNGCKVRTFNTNDFFACSEPWLHAWKLSLEMHFRVRDTQRHVNFIIKLASGSIFS